MEDVSILFICLVPAAVLALMLAGTAKIFDVLYRHCKPFRSWADNQTKSFESMEDEE